MWRRANVWCCRSSGGEEMISKGNIRRDIRRLEDMRRFAEDDTEESLYTFSVNLNLQYSFVLLISNEEIGCF